jgi:hypothetical protein
MSIDFNECLYLNGEKDNAASMLNKCINGSSELAWPCSGNELLDTSIYSTVTERPQGDNITGTLDHSLMVGSTNNALPDDHSGVEGFTNMGESYVKPGDCPDGYFWCAKSKRCKQVCMNCKYNPRTHNTSKEFNEADPCFPNRGVYNGIDNKGETQCTCGQNGQYCNDMFNAQGGLFTDNVFIMNVGNFGPLGKLASY